MDGCGDRNSAERLMEYASLTESSGGSIPPLYIAGGAAAIGAAIIGIVFAVKRGSGGTSAPKPARQDLDDYERAIPTKTRSKTYPKTSRDTTDIFVL